MRVDLPTIPCTTKTPKSNSYLENIILGSITFIGVCTTFGNPHLGWMLISALNSPTSFELNFTLNFFT